MSESEPPSDLSASVVPSAPAPAPAPTPAPTARRRLAALPAWLRRESHGTARAQSARPSPFWQWLARELQSRHSNGKLLAQAAGVSEGAISGWRQHGVIPNPATCRKLAAALDLDEAVVLERAGHLRRLGRVTRAPGALTDELRARSSVDQVSYALPVPALPTPEEELARAKESIRALPDDLLSATSRELVVNLLEQLASGARLALMRHAADGEADGDGDTGERPR